MNHGQNVLELRGLRRGVGHGAACADAFDPPARPAKMMDALRSTILAITIVALIGVGFSAGCYTGYWKGKSESMDSYFTDAAARMNALQPTGGHHGR